MARSQDGISMENHAFEDQLKAPWICVSVVSRTSESVEERLAMQGINDLKDESRLSCDFNLGPFCVETVPRPFKS